MSTTAVPYGATERTSPAGSAALAQAVDVLIALLAILVSTDAMNRFGVPSYLWMLVYALILFRLATNIPASLSLLLRNAPYFLYPFICLSSLIWSYSPNDTLVSSIQLAFTILIAIFIGERFSLRAIAVFVVVIIGITAALSDLNMVTGIFGRPFSPQGELQGIYTHKNALGQRVMVALVGSIALWLFASKNRSLLRITALLLGPANLIALGASFSATAILLLPVGAGLLLALGYRSLNRHLVLYALVGALFCVAVLPMLLAVLQLDIVSDVLGAFGKNATLTGRTGLWHIAGTLIEQSPIFGVGYAAFWNSVEFTNYIILLQIYGGGDNLVAFHNFILEVLVGTGLLGLIGMLVLIGTSVVRSARLWIAMRNMESAFALTMIALAVILGLVGASLYRQHEFSIMIVVIVGVAAERMLRQARSPG